MISNNHHIAWAAGFFDGEGHIGAVKDNRRGGTYAVSMCVVQAGATNIPPDTLLRFQNIAGCGTIAKRSASGRLGHRQQWVWRVSRVPEIREFAGRLFPYLGTAKADQISMALALRTENEELRADRKAFCPRGHWARERGQSARKFHCRECSVEFTRQYRRRRRLTAVASGKET